MHSTAIVCAFCLLPLTTRGAENGDQEFGSSDSGSSLQPADGDLTTQPRERVDQGEHRPVSDGEGVTAAEQSDQQDAEPLRAALATDQTVIDLGPDRDRVRFTFQEAPWPDVLREFAQWAGRTLDLTDTPAGYFSYFDNRMHTPSDAIDILNGYLLPRGYVLLRRDQFLVCIRTDNEMLPSLIPTIPLEELNELGENDLVSVMVPLQAITAATAAEEVSGLLGPFGKATPLESSRSILLQGFGSGLRQAIQVLSDSLPPVTDDKLDFRAYSIKNLPVTDVEKQLRGLFGVEGPGTARNVSGARSELDRMNYYRERSSRDGDRDRNDRSAPPIPLLRKVAMNMQVSSLERTNTLLVTATPEGLSLVERMLESIDVPTGRSTQELIKSTEPDLRVYGMVSADEGEVAKTIDVLLPGVIVNEDSRQDTIHVFATEDQHREVERLIRILDVSEGGSRDVVAIPLQRSDPSAVASFLNQLFSNDDRDERPMIQAELASRSIIVRGTSNQIDQVRAALMEFGEPGLARAETIVTPRIRRIEVGGANAARIAESTERLFSQQGSGNVEIRVVVPGAANQPGSSRGPSDAETKLPEQKADRVPFESASRSSHLFDDASAGPRSLFGSASAPLSARHVFRNPANRPPVSGESDAGATGAGSRPMESVQVGASQSISPSLQPDPPGKKPNIKTRSQKTDLLLTRTKTPTTSGSSRGSSYPDIRSHNRSKVRIEVVDNDLMISSGDPQALRAVESTILDLIRQMPGRTVWTVFYLRVAEAQNAAFQLAELTGELTYPTDSSGVVLAAQVNKSLRIIPDQRTNALFVSGTDKQIAEVESFLEFIDASEVPGSFMNRKPHAIEVRYADVEEVADLLRNLYKDYLVDPVAERLRARRSGDEGGGRRGEDDRPSAAELIDSPGIRLTLAVDSKTGELLVACNDQLFQEIESVVTQRDLAVRDRNPITQIVPVSDPIAEEVFKVLEGLSPRVTLQVISSEVPSSTSASLERRVRSDGNDERTDRRPAR